MPRRRYSRKRKYPYKRRRSYSRKRKLVRARKPWYRKMGIPAGIPSATRIGRFRYSQRVAVTSTGGALGTYVFRANSCYDPDYTGAGHQPMGWDEMSSLYKHYVVLGSRCVPRWSKQDAVDDVPTTIGCYLNDTFGTGYTSGDAFVEAKKGTIRFWTGKESTAIATPCSYSAKKFWNVTDVKDKSGELGAVVTTNPSKTAYFIMWASASLAGTEAFVCQVTIDYIVMFSERIEMGQS